MTSLQSTCQHAPGRGPSRGCHRPEARRHYQSPYPKHIDDRGVGGVDGGGGGGIMQAAVVLAR